MSTTSALWSICLQLTYQHRPVTSAAALVKSPELKKNWQLPPLQYLWMQPPLVCGCITCFFVLASGIQDAMPSAALYLI